MILCGIEHSGVLAFLCFFLPLLPFIHKNAAWDGLESKCVVAFKLLRDAEVSSAALAALTLTFLFLLCSFSEA